MKHDNPPQQVEDSGVPNLFGVFPLQPQFVGEKIPDELETPARLVFLNRVLDAKELG